MPRLQLVPLHSQDAPFKLPSVGTVTLGRRPNNTLVCNDISVSGKHCEISVESGLFKLSDCSTNGTYINEERIVRGETAPLRAGDVIALTKPPGVDSTVEPAVRVQFRVEAEGGDAERWRAPGVPSVSSCPAPPKRASTTAEGFAQDLLLQEQQRNAKITEELLLARRRLDEERSKSETLTRDLQQAQQSLEEERRRRSNACEQLPTLQAEVAKLKDQSQQLPEMRSAQASLQQKHERLEVEVTMAAQKASSLEIAVQRLRDEKKELTDKGDAQTLESAQEALRQAQEEANRLETEANEAQEKTELAQKEMEKLRQELNASRDQQAVLLSDMARAEKSRSEAEELLAKAMREIQLLEERVARHRREADELSAATARQQQEQQLQVQAAEEMRQACGRLAETLGPGGPVEWLKALPALPALPQGQAPVATEVPPVQPVEPPAVPQPAPEASAAPPTSQPRESPGAELVDSQGSSQEAPSQPSQPPPLPPPAQPPDTQETGAALGPVALPAPSAELVEAEAATFVDTAGPGAAPQRLWSVAVLGGTAVEDSLDGLLEASPKRRRVSVH
ncbi:unnamed protein product [Durusdinium trenchii]|uniref:E3 ubiquitin-protein ligase CHFR (Checkpoint with forkhead and RING finger domains protein) (RING-type E3 ubiquitin transferase CHFR) n=2 Tax=Durusdinium trenchii TaxID=1381693 RepID=A0ABP0QPV4_9DINO